MSALIQQLFGPGTRAPRWLTTLMVVGAVLFAWTYWHAAVRHGEQRNLDGSANDQKVYMNSAATMVGTNYGFSVPRLRMPGYMVVLSLVADPKVDHVGFFSKAKAFNVTFSLVCLTIVFFSVRPWLGTGLATCFILMAALQLYILRAAYVQPEVMLITVITLAVALLVEVLHRPTWWKALLAGLLCCLWHLTKASALIAVGSFMAAIAVKALLSYKDGKWKSYLLAMMLVAVAYIVPMTPYLARSYRTFGSPFYNAQSSFFIWCENESTKHMLQRSGVDLDLTNIKVPREELPGPAKYWRDHSWKHITKRLSTGTRDMLNMLVQEYTLLCYLLFVWAGIMLWALSRDFGATVAGMKSHWVPMLYVGGLIALYIFLFGWFTPLKVGPRLIASVSLVPLFFCMAVTHHFLKNQKEKILGAEISMEKLTVFLFLISWAYATCLQLPADLNGGYFGG